MIDDIKVYVININDLDAPEDDDKFIELAKEHGGVGTLKEFQNFFNSGFMDIEHVVIRFR